MAETLAAARWPRCRRLVVPPASRCDCLATRGSWRAGMTDRAAFLRRLPGAPDVAPSWGVYLSATCGSKTRMAD